MSASSWSEHKLGSMATEPWVTLRNTFQSAKTKFTKASKSRPSRLKRIRQIYDYSKRSTFENTNLPSIPEKNAANLRTFYFNNYFNISRDSSYFDTHSLVHSIHFYSFSFIFISCYYLAHAFTPTFSRISHVFTLHLYISLMRNIFLLSLMMP